MISSSNYMRRARWFSEKGDFICRVVEEKAFYYGMRNKRSFRLIAIAVIEEEQGNGLGSLLVAEMIEKCSEWGLEKITFRTHKNGNAVYFWKKIGAIITGEIGEDYEMRIDI